MFHIVEITDTAAKLSVNGGRLLVTTQEQQQFFTIEELDALILANPAVTVTGYVLNELIQNKSAIIVCQLGYRPSGILLPVGNPSAESRTTFTLQMEARIPLNKQLWRRLIQSKIANSSQVLQHYRNSSSLESFPVLVRSGDAGNMEARAACLYWKQLDIFPKRDRNAEDANRLLNYAYTILYAATARYICASTLHPHIGIKHHNQYNPFCLASDLMEPYRAYADIIVLKLLGENAFDTSLSWNNRQALMQALYNTYVNINNSKMLIFNAIQQTVFSFKRCLKEKTADKLLLPVLAA